MDIFAQKKLLMRIVVLLTLLNLFLMGFFLWKDIDNKQTPQGNNKGLKELTDILKRELNLSKDQVDKMRTLRTVYFEKEEKLAALIKGERDSINVLMFNRNTDSELVRSLAKRVAENDFKMEMLRFEQAGELKSVCTPEQVAKFDGLIIEIRDYFRQDAKPKRKR
jgi:Spy/CpxP family protein refolding chaperone